MSVEQIALDRAIKLLNFIGARYHIEFKEHFK